MRKSGSFRSGKTSKTLGYDANGNITSMTLADGKKIRCGYDEVNRIETVSYPDGEKARYKYDDADRITRTEYGDIETAFDYDPKGHILSKEIIFSERERSLRAKVKYEYGKKKEMRIRKVIVGDLEIQYVSDEKGILKRLSAGPLGTFTFDYDPKKGLKQITYPNGIEEQHSYGGAGKKITLTIKKAGDRLLSIDADLGSRGLTRSRTINGRKETYVYDKKGQITSYTSDKEKTTYRYDAWGNRTKENIKGKPVKYEYLSGARLSRRGNISYKWDAHGNLVSKNNRQGKTTFSFDHENRLVAIKGGKGKEVSYRYNARGFIVSRTAEGKTTYYLYDGYNPIAELDEKGNLLKAYVHAPGLNAILGMVEFHGKQSGNVVYFHRDERNNVVLVTNQKGAKVASYRYDPFGNMIARTGDFDSPFLFGGYRIEPLFNLYYQVARFYDPESGRFLSRDPLPGHFEDALSTNPYIYVKNSPMNFVDPMGTSGMPALSGSMGRASRKSEPTLTLGDAAMTAYEAAVKHRLKRKEKGEAAYSLTRDLSLTLAKGMAKAANNREYYSSGHMVEEMLLGKGGKWAKNASKKIDILGKSLGHAFSIGNYWVNTNKIINDYTSGKLTAEEAYQERYFETLNVFGSAAVGSLTGAVVGSMATALGVTGAAPVIVGAIATTIVTTKTMSAYKYVFLGGEAKEKADKAVEDERVHHRRLVKDKMAQFKQAIKDGDFEKAKRLKKGIKVYANSRQARGEQDILKTSEKHDLDFAYFDARYEDFKAKREASEKRMKESKQFQDDLLDKAKAWDKKRQEKEKASKAQAAAWEAEQMKKMAAQPLRVRLTLSKKEVKPGDRLTARLSISGGKPPYRLSGDTSGDCYGSENIQFTAPRNPGQYAIRISAVDAEIRKGSAQAVFEVIRKKQVPVTQGTLTGSFEGGKGTSGSIRITISGTRVTGSYTGKNKHYDATFSGSLTGGTYDYRTGAINGRLRGTATYMEKDKKGKLMKKREQLRGPFRGAARRNMASGSWGYDGRSITGTWETRGGINQLFTRPSKKPLKHQGAF